jgi:urease gamma subunit
MAKARFESYVEERVAELAAARRAKFKAAYDAEVAKVERQRDRYLKAVEDGVEALVRKVVAQAAKDGCTVDETEDAKTFLSKYVKDKVREMVGLQTEYDYDVHERVWPEGTPARKAQDALKAFDELCAKEARRIVVYKMDLGMKPEAFEKMLAEVAEKINKE